MIIGMKKTSVLLMLVFYIGFVFAISANPNYIKSSVIVGEEKVVSIDFYCESECLIESEYGFFSLSSDSGVGEFQIDISFDDVSEGVYVSSLSSGEVIVPVVLEVNSERSDFAIVLDVSSGDKEIEQLGTVFSKINLHSLKAQEMEAEVFSYIYDLSGNVLYSDVEDFSVTDRYSYAKTISLDDSYLPGGYVFAAVVKSGTGTVVSSYSFDVVEKKRGFFASDSIFFILIVLFILVLILFIVFYMLYERKVFLKNIERRHSEELRFYANKIKEEELASVSQVDTEKEKMAIREEFADAKDKILNQMKKEHSKQKQELEKIKLEKKKVSKEDIAKIHKDVYNKALRSSSIGVELKNKLVVLDRAYDEGMISKDSLSKGKKRISKAHSKLKRNVYK